MDYLGRPYYTLTGAGGGGGGGGTGDVVGPSSSTVNAVARFAGTDGKTIKNSGVTITDIGVIQGVLEVETDFVSSVGSLVVEGASTVEIRAPGSSIRVQEDVVVDSDGNVSLTGRAAPHGLSLSGNTILSGNLDITGQIIMNGFSQIKGVALPSLPSDAATKEYVDSRSKGWGQMLYNSPTNATLVTSGQLSTTTFNRLMEIIDPVPANYFITTSNTVSVLDNVGFVLQVTGNYKLRYRVGLLSTAASQIVTLALRINNVIAPASEQYVVVDNVAVKYYDFEYIFTTTVSFETVLIFAKVATTATAISTSYLCFNVISF
jgi:hypothetical protein